MTPEIPLNHRWSKTNSTQPLFLASKVSVGSNLPSNSFRAVSASAVTRWRLESGPRAPPCRGWTWMWSLVKSWKHFGCFTKVRLVALISLEKWWIWGKIFFDHKQYWHTSIYLTHIGVNDIRNSLPFDIRWTFGWIPTDPNFQIMFSMKAKKAKWILCQLHVFHQVLKDQQKFRWKTPKFGTNSSPNRTQMDDPTFRPQSGESRKIAFRFLSSSDLICSSAAAIGSNTVSPAVMVVSFGNWLTFIYWIVEY